MIHVLKLVTFKVWHGVYIAVIVSSSAAMMTESAMMDKATRVEEYMYQHMEADDYLAKLFTHQQVVDLRTKGYFVMSDRNENLP